MNDLRVQQILSSRNLEVIKKFPEGGKAGKPSDGWRKTDGGRHMSSFQFIEIFSVFLYCCLAQWAPSMHLNAQEHNVHNLVDS